MSLTHDVSYDDELLCFVTSTWYVIFIQFKIEPESRKKSRFFFLMKKALFDWNCILPLINVLLAVLKKNTSEHTLLVTLKKIIIANIWPLFCICMDPALKRSPHIFSRLEVRALGSSFQKLYGSFLNNCRFQDQTILWKYKLLCCVITLPSFERRHTVNPRWGDID